MKYQKRPQTLKTLTLARMALLPSGPMQLPIPPSKVQNALFGDTKKWVNESKGLLNPYWVEPIPPQGQPKLFPLLGTPVNAQYNLSMQEPQIKPDWKDFLALVMAAYSILLSPVLAILGTGLLVLLLLHWVF